MYEELSYLSFQAHFLTNNTFSEISRFDIHNIIKVEIIINRYSQDIIMGDSTIFYKNSNDEWITHYTIAENTTISGRNE